MNRVGKNIKFLTFLFLMVFCIFFVYAEDSDSSVSSANDVQNTEKIKNLKNVSGKKEKAVLVNSRGIRLFSVYDRKQNKIRILILFWMFLTVHNNKWKDSRFFPYVLKSTLEKCRKSKCRVCVRRGPPISEKFAKRKDLRI